MDEIALPGGQCEANLVLKWMTEVSSAIYATPLITDLYSDSFKDIIVPSFVHYTEVASPSTFHGLGCLGSFVCRPNHHSGPEPKLADLRAALH